MVMGNTVGVIAGRLGKPVHTIQYVIKSRNIQPAFTAGCARVFDEKGVAAIDREIKAIQRSRRVLQPSA